jgi:phosphopantothenoylcysteine decarboxylase / phosphopantothenate---cysteine ligase
MNILLGVSGGIAAYKSADLVRLFVKDGHDVKVILTENAKKFVSHITLETLSKNGSYSDMFSDVKDVKHISLAKWADLMIIAPATASTIAKISCGLCDDLLSAVVTALDKPCYIFPSMNTKMYTHPSVQENIAKLRDWGYVVYEPAEGELACGDSGKGRLPEVDLVYEIVMGETERSQIDSPLFDKKLTITAGSTRAYIDPVRYIVNSSSGRTGVELVRHAWLRGAKVNLICNKDVVEKFPWVTYYAELITIAETTEDVLKAAQDVFNQTDVYISSAALCDFANNPLKKKIKKTAKETNITLKPAVDVFYELSKNKKNQLMIGFALETDDLEDNASIKLREKGMDMVVANTVDVIGAENSKVAIIDTKGIRKYIKEDEKRNVCSQILDEVEKIVVESFDKNTSKKDLSKKEDILINTARNTH